MNIYIHNSLKNIGAAATVQLCNVVVICPPSLLQIQHNNHKYKTCLIQKYQLKKMSRTMSHVI